VQLDECCISHPRLYRGQGRGMGLYPSVEEHLVYPWCGKSGETPPLILGGPVRSFLGIWGSSAVGLKLSLCGFSGRRHSASMSGIMKNCTHKN